MVTTNTDCMTEQVLQIKRDSFLTNIFRRGLQYQCFVTVGFPTWDKSLQGDFFSLSRITNVFGFVLIEKCESFK